MLFIQTNGRWLTLIRQAFDSVYWYCRSRCEMSRTVKGVDKVPIWADKVRKKEGGRTVVFFWAWEWSYTCLRLGAKSPAGVDMTVFVRLAVVLLGEERLGPCTDLTSWLLSSRKNNLHICFSFFCIDCTAVWFHFRCTCLCLCHSEASCLSFCVVRVHIKYREGCHKVLLKN